MVFLLKFEKYQQVAYLFGIFWRILARGEKDEKKGLYTSVLFFFKSTLLPKKTNKQHPLEL